MADLEAVLADVSYLMAMEKSKCTPAARASKKIILPDPRYECPVVVVQLVAYLPFFSVWSTVSGVLLKSTWKRLVKSILTRSSISG